MSPSSLVPHSERKPGQSNQTKMSPHLLSLSWLKGRGGGGGEGLTTLPRRHVIVGSKPRTAPSFLGEKAGNERQLGFKDLL